MRFSAVLVLLHLFFGSVAQDYIGDKRKKVKASLEAYMRETGVVSLISQTDSSLVLPLTDPKFKPVDFTFLFDKEDKCVAEIRTGCDTCVAKYLDEVLEKRKYGWTQTAPNIFLSNSRYRLQTELQSSQKGSTLQIKKLALSRNDYNRLLHKRE